MKLALAGDTMLGRGVAEELTRRPPSSLVEPALAEITRDADLFLLNLECCISERGRPMPKEFTFRAPPAAVELLTHLGVGCVALANNHALDYGTDALLDTFEHLRAAGIRWAGAGMNIEEARAPVALDGVTIVAFADHPSEFEAADDRPGIAYVDLQRGLPDWLRQSTRGALVTPHWGPNMTPEPRPEVRSAAQALRDAGAMLVAGHSAHVFHGVQGSVLFDLGDFIDDYATNPRLRNDLGLLFLVELEPDRAPRIEAVPLRLDYCYTRLARGDDARWVRDRFRAGCAAMGTDVLERGGRLVVS